MVVLKRNDSFKRLYARPTLLEILSLFHNHLSDISNKEHMQNFIRRKF